MKIPRPVPEVLAKKGIKEAVHILEPSQSVNFAAAFVRLFRTEIEARIFKPQAQQPGKRRRRKKL